MPWPKGVPHTKKMISARLETLSRNGKRHKKPDADGRWRCGTCKKWKYPCEFHKDKRTPNGLKSQCRACHSKTSLATRDPEKAKASRRRSEATRRARKNKCKVQCLPNEMQELERLWGNVCLKCGDTENLQWDHIIPLAHRGNHSIENMQRLCRSCNERKQASFADYRCNEQKVWAVKFKPPEAT